MRRRDREITDKKELMAILLRHDIARVAFSDEGQPYLVPLNFAPVEQDGQLDLYFHCAAEGRKLRVLEVNDRVAFEVDGAYRLLPGDEACDWSATFESVIGEGRMALVTDADERMYGMDRIMSRYGHTGNRNYIPSVFDRTTILRLRVTRMTGKRKAPPSPAGQPAT